MGAIAEFDRDRTVIVDGDDVAHARPQLAGRARSFNERLLVDALQVAGEDVELECEHLEQESQRVVGLRVGAFHDVASSDVS